MRRTGAEELSVFGRAERNGEIGVNRPRRPFVVDCAAIAGLRIDARRHVDSDDRTLQIADALIHAIETHIVARFVPDAENTVDYDDIAAAFPFENASGIVCIANVIARQ